MSTDGGDDGRREGALRRWWRMHVLRKDRPAEMVEAEERAGRMVARWNGRIMLYLGVPMMLLLVLGDEEALWWQRAIWLVALAGVAWGCARWIRWGKQPPRNAAEVEAAEARMRERRAGVWRTVAGWFRRG